MMKYIHITTGYTNNLFCFVWKIHVRRESVVIIISLYTLVFAMYISFRAFLMLKLVSDESI